MEAKKLLALLSVLLGVFCLTESVRRNRMRRWRRETCPNGNYSTKGLLCCLCHEGEYLIKDCDVTFGNPKCEECEPGSYADHPNHEIKCELCKECPKTNHMEFEQICTSISNAVCRCQDGHYCDKGDECKVCYPWSECEFGIKVEGSHTHDRQCYEKAERGFELAIILPILIILAIAAAAVFIFWKKKMFCWRKSPQQSDEPMDLLDPDLLEFLPKIAEILGFKVVRSVVRRQGNLPQTRIDDIMDENPQDARERAYQLLKAWYEAHGKDGAYKALRKNLNGINEKRNADAVRDLIKGEQSNGAVGRNGEI